MQYPRLSYGAEEAGPRDEAGMEAVTDGPLAETNEVLGLAA